MVLENFLTCLPINRSSCFTWKLDEKPHTHSVVENHVETPMIHPFYNDHNASNIHLCCKHIILHDPPRRLKDLEVIIHESIPTYEDSRTLDILYD